MKLERTGYCKYSRTVVWKKKTKARVLSHNGGGFRKVADSKKLKLGILTIFGKMIFALSLSFLLQHFTQAALPVQITHSAAVVNLLRAVHSQQHIPLWRNEGALFSPRLRSYQIVPIKRLVSTLVNAWFSLGLNECAQHDDLCRLSVDTKPTQRAVFGMSIRRGPEGPKASGMSGAGRKQLYSIWNSCAATKAEPGALGD